MAGRSCTVVACTGLALAWGAAAQAQKPRPSPKPAARFAKLPLAFEPGTHGDFLARGPGYVLRLHAGQAELALAGGGAVKLALAGARATAGRAGTKLASVTNEYFGKDPKRWRTGVPNYGEVRYANVYPGVSVRYYGHQGELESDFVLAPGADAARIRLQLSGKPRLRDGALELRAGGAASVRLGRPEIYQVIGGRRRRIAGGYVMRRGEVRFPVGAYDHKRPLVIDPTLTYSYLAPGGFSTVLGGNVIASGLMSQQAGFGVQGNGDTVLVGLTNAANFPVTNGGTCGQLSNGNCFAQDVFVTEFNASGTGLVFSTYYGSQSGSQSMADAAATLDASGNIYVAGQTNATDLPVTSGVVQAGAGDNYLAKFNASGGLSYSTYLGGSGMQIFAVAADGAGDAYVAGQDYTYYNDVPEVNPLPDLCSSSCEAGFVLEVNPAATQYAYGTPLTTSDSLNMTVWALAVDGAGHIYLGGQTDSLTLPAVQAIQPTCPTAAAGATYCASAGFLMELNPQLSGSGQILFSTYLGGTAPSTTSKITSLALDGASPPNLYAVGFLDGAGLPVTANAFEQQLGYGIDPTYAQNAYVAKIPTGTPSHPAYITYLGGTGSDTPEAIAADAQGDAWIAGITNSTDYPVTSPILAACPNGPNNCDNGFVSELDPTGSNLLYSTYIGGHGTPSDYVTGVGFDASGNVYIGGLTSSPDFPTTAGAYQSVCLETSGGICTQFAAFAAKLAAEPAPSAPAVAFSVNGQALGAGGYNFGNGFVNFGSSVVITATNTSTSDALQITKLYANGPNDDFGAGSASGSLPACNLGPVAPGGSCAFTATWYAYQAGPDTGAIEVLDNANGGPPSPQIIPLSGNAINGAQATVTSTGTNFGDVLQGQTATETVTITSSGNQALTIASIGLAGASDFTLGTAPTNPCPLTGTTLGAAYSSTDTSHNCEVEVIYTANGAFGAPESATLSITDNSMVTAPATATQTVLFSGATMQAQPAIQANLSSVTFPAIGLDTSSATVAVPIVNDGPGTLLITQVGFTGANAGDFHISADTCVNASLSEFAGCTIGLFFTPTATPAGPESAALQITSNNPVNPFLVPLTGAGGAAPGPPASWPLLVSADNEVPPAAGNGGATTAAVSGNGQYVAITDGTVYGLQGNLPGPSGPSVTGAGLYLRNTCAGAAAGCTQSTQYIAYGPTSGSFSNGGAACDTQQTTITMGATNPQISGDGRFVAFNDDACPLTPNPTGAQLIPGPVYLRDLQANGGAGATTVVTDAGGNALESAFAMSEDARFFAYLTNPTGGGQPEITETDTCQSDGAAACTTPQDVLVSQSNNGTPDSSPSYLLTRPALSPDGRYAAFASDWDDVNGVVGKGVMQVYLRDTCLGAPSGTACTPKTILVSQDAGGNPGTGGNSGYPYFVGGSPISGIAVSKGGRYVVFTSDATNLPQPVNGNGTYPQELYLRDTLLGTTTLLSTTVDGSTPAGDALQPHISADGRIITFVDNGALVAGAPATGYQGAVYSYDTCTSNGTAVSGCTPGLKAIVSEQTGTSGTENVMVSDAELSADGSAAAYTGPPYNCTNCTQVWLNELGAAAPIQQGAVVTLASLTPSTTTPAPGQPYSYSLTAENKGATGATDVTLSDTLPSGAAFVSASGGTCTAAGGVVNCDLGPLSAGASATVTITLDAPNTPGATLTDSASLTTGSQQNLAVQTLLTSTITEATLQPPPSIITTSLPPGLAGAAYPATQIATTGGTGAVTVSQSGGTLPPGLGLSANTLAGVPDTAGSYSFSLLATDSNNVVSAPQPYTVTIACPNIAVGAVYVAQVAGATPLSVPTTLDLTAGALIPAVQFVATLPLGDTLPLVFSESGPLDGLAFNPATAQLSGTPALAGTFTFTVSVSGGGCTASSATYTLVVAAPAAISLPVINEAIHTTDTIGTPNTLISAVVLPAVQETVHTSDAIGSPNTLISAEVLPAIQEAVHASDTIGAPNTLISAVVLPAVQESVHATDALAPAPEACALPAGVSLTLGGYVRRFGSTIYSQVVTLTNTSGSPITGPIYYLLGNLTGATAYGAAGVTDSCAPPAGTPYFATAGPLAAGASVQVVVHFTNVTGIHYTPSVLTGGTP